MMRLLLSVLAGMLLLPGVAPQARGAAAFYVNNGTVTDPPVIDATNFVNNGTFDLYTLFPPDPFETFDTLNFTNNGTMTGRVGWRFSTAPSPAVGGPRRMAASFVNRLNGTVSAEDYGWFYDNETVRYRLFPSYLFMNATNIINQGLLSAGANGELNLVGTNINLSRSGLQIAPIVPTGSFQSGSNSFVPDVGISDNYWAQTNMTFDSSGLLFSFGPSVVVITPSHQVRWAGGFPGSVQFGMIDPVMDFNTNVVGGVFVTATNFFGQTNRVFVVTNVIRQAAFVSISDPANMTARIRWADSPNAGNDFKSVAVELAVGSSNLVTAFPETTTIYFVDTLASEAGRGLWTNDATLSTFRPVPYLVSRLVPAEFGGGLPGNYVFTNNFFYEPFFTNANVSGPYAAYSPHVDNVAWRPPVVPGTAVTNLPGRIKIDAQSLDLNRTRMRAEGWVQIQARHLVGSSNAVVDSENLSYQLASTNGLLRVQNLAKESVARLRGDMYAWSGLWTNRSITLTENYRTISNLTVLWPLTNTLQIGFHTLILYADPLVAQLPVIVHDLVTHSTNVVLSDNMAVVQSLLIDGQSLTLNGSLTLSNIYYYNAGNLVNISLDNWVSTNGPNLKYFTNSGTFTIPNEAHFGDDRPTPYAAFVNSGAINAGGQVINSDYCEISGTHRAGASVAVITRSGKVDGGSINAGADIQISADVVKFARCTLFAGNRLDLAATNALFDDGPSSSNVWSCADGFRLPRQPQTGDLLGTTIQTKAPMFAQVNHLWAAEDRGPGIAGYSNNLALGKLILVVGGFDPLFVFSGTGTSNGLYVDSLDLSQLSSLENELQIDPNLVIYFAAANVGFALPPGYGPEEYLDGQLGGRLRWVRDFAGPNSSVDVLINGSRVIKVNRALRFSKIIDSNGNGIPNYYDMAPFDGVALAGALLQSNAPPSKAFSVTWNAAPNTVYQIEFTTNLLSGNWQPLLSCTNNVPAFRIVTVCDTNLPAGARQRFYRARYVP